MTRMICGQRHRHQCTECDHAGYPSAKDPWMLFEMDHGEAGAFQGMHLSLFTGGPGPQGDRYLACSQQCALEHAFRELPHLITGSRRKHSRGQTHPLESAYANFKAAFHIAHHPDAAIRGSTQAEDLLEIEAEA